MSIFFSDLRSPQIERAADENAALVLPVGQIEEHGPHLPIKTDLLIAEKVCENAVQTIENEPPTLVLDPVAYGFSGAIMKQWAGTFIIPQNILVDYIENILLSAADMGFGKLVIVSTHGNHVGVLRTVARNVADAIPNAPGLYFPYACATEILDEYGKAGPGGSCHGGEFETSVMLHLAPELVDLEDVTDEDTIQGNWPYSSSEAYVSTWSREETKQGIYGDPTVATESLGKRAFDVMVQKTADFIRDYANL